MQTRIKLFVPDPTQQRCHSCLSLAGQGVALHLLGPWKCSLLLQCHSRPRWAYPVLRFHLNRRAYPPRWPAGKNDQANSRFRFRMVSLISGTLFLCFNFHYRWTLKSAPRPVGGISSTPLAAAAARSDFSDFYWFYNAVLCLIATQNSFCICAFVALVAVYFIYHLHIRTTTRKAAIIGDGHSHARALYHPAKIRTLILGSSDRYHLIRIYCDCHVIFGLMRHLNFLCSRSIWPATIRNPDPDPHSS